MKSPPRLSTILVYFSLLVIPNIQAQKPGDIDLSFGNLGFASIDISEQCVITCTAVQTDDKILIGGISIHNFENTIKVIRFTSEGLIDYSFANEGIFNFLADSLIIGDITSVTTQTDNKIIIANSVYNQNTHLRYVLLIRLNSTGQIDNSFGANGILLSRPSETSIPVYATCLLTDKQNRIIVGGYHELTLTSEILLARYENNGILDITFGENGFVRFYTGNWSSSTFNVEEIYSICLENEKILVAGANSQWDVVNGSYYGDYAILARFNANGSIDSSFNSVGYINKYQLTFFKSIALSRDEKIIAVGNDYPYPLIIEFNSDGSINNEFAEEGIVTDNSMNNKYSSVAIQQNNKILTRLDNFDFNITRYNQNGVIDTTFGEEGKAAFEINCENDGENYLNSLVIQKNGKILVSGVCSESFSVVRYWGDVTIPDQFDQQLFSYPNPFSDQIAFATNTIFSDEVTITILNINGEKVLEKTFADGEKYIFSNLNQLANGIYLAVLKSGDLIISGKIIRI